MGGASFNPPAAARAPVERPVAVTLPRTRCASSDATLTTLVDGSTGELQSSSGIALRGQTLFVTDNATSRVLAFDLSGHLLDWLDLSSQVEAGALMGITFDAAGAMYLVDAVGNRLLMISPMAP